MAFKFEILLAGKTLDFIFGHSLTNGYLSLLSTPCILYGLSQIQGFPRFLKAFGYFSLKSLQ